MPIKKKAITAKMKKQIRKAAKAVGVAAPDFSEGGGKTYEAWVLMELAKRVQPEINVQPFDHTGALTKSFRIRGGPGYLPSAHSAVPEPCHFLLAGPGGNAELHSSLRHCGCSGDTHELDLSVVDPSRAKAIRMDGGGPFDAGPLGSETLLGVELKEYDRAQSLPKVYSRALLGVALDLEPYVTFIVERRRSVRSFVLGGVGFWLLTTTTLGTSKQLLQHHGIGWGENVEPGLDESPLKAVADQLKRRLA